MLLACDNPSLVTIRSERSVRPWGRMGANQVPMCPTCHVDTTPVKRSPSPYKYARQDGPLPATSPVKALTNLDHLRAPKLPDSELACPLLPSLSGCHDRPKASGRIEEDSGCHRAHHHIEPLPKGK
jgi:hypothetical protein